MTKPDIPDERIREILAMLAEGKKWDDIESVAYSRSMIAKVRSWYDQLPLTEAIAFAAGNWKILRLRSDWLALSTLSQRKQLAEFLASLSLPNPSLIQTRDFFDFAEGNIEGLLFRLNRGICSLCYAPPYLSHHLFFQTKKISPEDPLWRELDKFIRDFNKLLVDCSDLWRDVYCHAKEALDVAEAKFPGVTKPLPTLTKEVSKDGQLLSSVKLTPLSASLDLGYHRFVPLAYEDAVGWALGKNLTHVRKQDYDYGCSGEKQFVVRYQLPDHLAIIIQFHHEDESTGFQLAAHLRDKHIEFRQQYRENEQVKKLAQAMNQLEVQRENILKALKGIANSLVRS